MKDIQFNLVGCGRIAKRHAELLASGSIPGAKLSAVCDVKRDRASQLGDRYNIPWYTDYNEMMSATNCDVVSVLTESGNHARHTLDLSRYGKHIVVEKPMALTLRDADRMIRECAERQIKLFVVKQNRFNVPVRKLRDALESGRFGRLVLGTVRVRWCRPQHYYNQDTWRGTWAMDGGVITNQASHHIDLLEWMMGEVESVYARGMTALVDVETEDTAAAILKFRNGAMGIIEATTATRPKDLEGSLSILGEHGSVEIGGFAVNEMKVWNFTEVLEEDERVLEDFSVNPPDVYGFGHREYLAHVVDCIKSNTHQLVDGFEGRKSLELIMALYESMETGKEVKMRFQPEHCRLGIGNEL